MSKQQTCSQLADATFIGLQERPGKPPLALYNITRPGHPRENSTVAAETLKHLGLAVPATKPSERTKCKQSVGGSDRELLGSLLEG